MEFPRICPARWLSGQNFGMCMPPHDFMFPFYDTSSHYYRSWNWSNQSISKEFGSTIENEKGNYKITLDVQHFRSNEINVKVTDNEIIVEGSHEERPDTHGFITRRFKRRYPLPSHCPSENVTSFLSSDGVLTIIAEKRSSVETEKIVPIKMCGICPRKSQMETKITSEITQKTQKENIKDTEDFISKNRSQTMFKEDHSRLLKPELLKETILETNGTCAMKTTMKESNDVTKAFEKTDPLNIGSTSSKIEESIGKSILGLTALTEQLGHSSLTSSSEINAIKIVPETCGMKDQPEKCGVKSTADTSGIKSASEMSGTEKALEMSDMKTASEKSAMKNASEMCAKKGVSEICDMKAMSKTLIEESSSSYKSSSSMSSSTRVSGKTGECVSDISAELREAAENV